MKKENIRKVVRPVLCRPIFFIGLLIFFCSGWYIRSPLFDNGRYLFRDREGGYFFDMGISEGEEIIISGRIKAISNKSSYGQDTISVVLTDVEHKNTNLTGMWQSVTASFSKDEQVHIGQKIRLHGKIRYYTEATNPGEFDYYAYNLNRGNLFSIRNAVVEAKGSRYYRISDALSRLRCKGEERLTASLDQVDAAIMKAMLFGNKSELSEDTRKLFAQNGIAHILAISGLHISFLAMTLFSVMKKGGVSTRISAVVCSVCIVLYGVMVGFPVSAVRAIIMFIIAMLGRSLLRTYDMLSSMGVALIIIMVMKPGYFNDAGFLLSFLAIFSVAYLMPFYKNSIWRIPSILEPALVSLCVFIFSLPVLLSTYYEVAFYSVILNLIIIPLMSVLLLSGVCIFTPFSFIGIKGVTFILWIYKGTCSILEEAGMGRINLGRPATYRIVMYYLLILLFNSPFFVNYLKKHKFSTFRRVFIHGMAVAFAVFILVIRFHTGINVCMLDVGQGECMIIQNTNGHVYVIDGGSSDVKNVGKKRIIPALKSMGVNEIEGVFITHPDEDHQNGIRELIELDKEEHLKIKNVYVYDGFLNNKGVFEDLDIAAKGISMGTKFRDKGLEISVLYPQAGMPVTNTNNASLVMHVKYKDFDLITTGDLEKEGESWLVNNHKLPADTIEILKVAHHGSDSSSGDSFLESLSPACSLISAPEKSRYGHPHAETLERLKKSGTKICITRDCGAISLWSDGKKVRIHSNN